MPPALPTLTAAIAAWIDAKAARSGSTSTAVAYRDTMAGFRAYLDHEGLDLDGQPAAIAAAAEAFAAHGRRPVSPATFNQRLAIISSFYVFAHRRQLLTVANPIALVERRAVQDYAGARGLAFADVRASLAAIDRATHAGLREYALLAVLLQTGRRVSEVGALELGDVAGELLTFRRCKGGKTMVDTLPDGVAAALAAWLCAAYPGYPQSIHSLAAPVWRDDQGGRLAYRHIAAICKRHLGTTRVHSTRHTFARAMEDAGAKVSDIQRRLGHSSLATTGRYLAALQRAENAQGDAIAELLGLD